jgi:hypothetical protein
MICVSRVVLSGCAGQPQTVGPPGKQRRGPEALGQPDDRVSQRGNDLGPADLARERDLEPGPRPLNLHNVQQMRLHTR